MIQPLLPSIPFQLYLTRHQHFIQTHHIINTSWIMMLLCDVMWCCVSGGGELCRVLWWHRIPTRNHIYFTIRDYIRVSYFSSIFTKTLSIYYTYTIYIYKIHINTEDSSCWSFFSQIVFCYHVRWSHYSYLRYGIYKSCIVPSCFAQSILQSRYAIIFYALAAWIIFVYANMDWRYMLNLPSFKRTRGTMKKREDVRSDSRESNNLSEYKKLLQNKR